ncbi:MAG: MSMEG_1061 family FMN-dependent PPOX-type flavoprotein [Pseudomonadota bacterium]
MVETFGRRVDEVVADRASLRREIGAPSARVLAKVTDRIDAMTARFIAASPFAMLATRRADGGVDVTPRGDPAGFAKVLEPRLLALPERPGNRRLDALENLLEDPRLGLIFLIPGEGTTLRVSGEARIVRDSALAEAMAAQGRTPELIVLLRVERVLVHCPKAFLRSGLWRPETWGGGDVPSMAEMMVAHGELSETVDEMAEVIARDARERLY